MNEPSTDRKASGVNTPTDHPDDQAARERLRAVFYVARKDLNLRFCQVSARAGKGVKWAGDMEVRSDSLHWKFDDVWVWGQTLGKDVFLNVGGIPALGLRSIGPLARMSIGSSAFGGVGLLEYLKTLRVQMKVEQVELARRLDVNSRSVYDIEESGNPKISSLQRYTRGIGGWLEFQVEPCEPRDVTQVVVPF